MHVVCAPVKHVLSGSTTARLKLGRLSYSSVSMPGRAHSEHVKFNSSAVFTPEASILLNASRKADNQHIGAQRHAGYLTTCVCRNCRRYIQCLVCLQNAQSTSQTLYGALQCSLGVFLHCIHSPTIATVLHECRSRTRYRPQY